MGQGEWLSILVIVYWTAVITCNSGTNETETSNRRGKALNISKKPCSDPSGRKGICTFKWDCISQNGTKIGTCMDGFIVGTCCYHDIKLHQYFSSADDIMMSSQYLSLDKPSKQAQDVFLRNNTSTTQLPKITDMNAIDSSTLISNSPQTQNTLHLVTWTPVSPTKWPHVSKPVKITLLPSTQGASHPYLQNAETVTYPVKPHRPNLYQYKPHYYGPFYAINNHKTPIKNPQINTGNFTIFDGADNTSITLHTTTVSIPSPQKTSTKTSGKIPVINTINRLPLPTIVRPGLSYNVIGPVSVTTTMKTNLSTSESLMHTATTKKPQKKPLLDYRKDCGVRALSPRARIVGGASAHFGKWPWQILVKEAAWLGLYHKNKCGGVLISSKYAITAGHCQPGFLSSLIVVLGEYDLTTDLEVLKPEMRRVKRMVVHRHYNPQNFDNDIAILELDPPVVFKPHISPICLPEKDEQFTGKMAYVTGWGKTRHGGAIPNLLQEVQVPIVSNTKCLDMFKAAGHVKIIKDNFLCAGYESGGKDSCEGDSGGPLMVKRDDGRWVLAGTVSHGIRCADPNLPGVYMRISTYRPWIDKIIGS